MPSKSADKRLFLEIQTPGLRCWCRLIGFLLLAGLGIGAKALDPQNMSPQTLGPVVEVHYPDVTPLEFIRGGPVEDKTITIRWSPDGDTSAETGRHQGLFFPWLPFHGISMRSLVTGEVDYASSPQIIRLNNEYLTHVELGFASLEDMYRPFYFGEIRELENRARFLSGFQAGGWGILFVTACYNLLLWFVFRKWLFGALVIWCLSALALDVFYTGMGAGILVSWRSEGFFLVLFSWAITAAVVTTMMGRAKYSETPLRDVVRAYLRFPVLPLSILLICLTGYWVRMESSSLNVCVLVILLSLLVQWRKRLGNRHVLYTLAGWGLMLAVISVVNYRLWHHEPLYFFELFLVNWVMALGMVLLSVQLGYQIRRLERIRLKSQKETARIRMEIKARQELFQKQASDLGMTLNDLERSLTMINGELKEHEPELLEKTQPAQSRLFLAARNIQQLYDDLLTYLKVDFRRMNPHLQSVDIRMLVEKLLSSTRLWRQDFPVTVDVSYHASLNETLLRADRLALEQVLFLALDFIYQIEEMSRVTLQCALLEECLTIDLKGQSEAHPVVELTSVDQESPEFDQDLIRLPEGSQALLELLEKLVNEMGGRLLFSQSAEGEYAITLMIPVSRD